MTTIIGQNGQPIARKNKGFTLTEMIIVIAVIAILAAVLIPTFIGISNKAKLSADVQAAKNATTLASGETDIQQIYNKVAKEDAKPVDLFSTQYAKCFAYETKSQSFVLLNDKYEIIENDAVKNQTEINLWLFAKDNKAVSNAEKLSSYTSVSYFLVNDYSGNFSFPNLVGFSTGDSTLNGNVYYGESNAITTNATIEIAGNINGKVYVNAPSAEVNQKGYIKELDIKAVKGNSFNVGGRVGEVTIAQGRLAVAKNAYVTKVVVPTSAVNDAVKIEAKGFINTVKVDNASAINEVKFDGGIIASTEGQTIPEGKKTGESATEITIATTSELESFRDQVNAGTTFEGYTIKLTNDIRLNDGWTPIGAFARNARKNSTEVPYGINTKLSFAGTFDGGEHTISNLNTTGFDVNNHPAMLGTNSTTYMGREEFAYGLFGVITGKDNPVVIKGLTISAPQINITGNQDSAVFGDSVAALVGYISGSATINNVKVVGGNVTAHDAVGGIVGRIYDVGAVVITNCESSATLTANCKVGGIVGFVSRVTGANTASSSLQITGCTYNGIIKAIPAFNPTQPSYGAGIIGSVSGAKTRQLTYSIQNCTIKGTVEVTNQFEGQGAYVDALATEMNTYVVSNNQENTTTELIIKQNGQTL